MDHFYDLFGMGGVEGMGSSHYHLRQYLESEHIGFGVLNVMYDAGAM